MSRGSTTTDTGRGPIIAGNGPYWLASLAAAAALMGTIVVSTESGKPESGLPSTVDQIAALPVALQDDAHVFADACENDEQRAGRTEELCAPVCSAQVDMADLGLSRHVFCCQLGTASFVKGSKCPGNGVNEVCNCSDEQLPRVARTDIPEGEELY